MPVCKLTATHGPYVKAHIIPKALTRPIEPGLPFVQAGQGRPPTRRWSSWYDQRLVTRQGEDILSALDDWAVSELRRERLVWSGWGPSEALQVGERVAGSPWGFRKATISEPARLRLFFLSLLWRAAASELPEFDEVQLPTADFAALRELLVTGNPGDIAFYPTMLTQLSTVGVVHNMTPYAVTKTLPVVGDFAGRMVNSYRFYFDGLIAHIHRHASDDGATAELGPLVVGAESDLVLGTVTFERSFQLENLMRFPAGGETRGAAQMTPLREGEGRR